MEVTVKGGTALKQLVKYLDDQGLAMKNLGSILEQTVAGAISTGTHGNGLEFGSLATLVTRLEFVNGKGELVSTSGDSNPELFKAAQVSVGLLGIITEVTFQVERSYLLRETLTAHTLERCLLDFDSLMRSGEHTKMWIELFSEKCAVFAANKTTETAVRDNPNWTRKNIEVYIMEAVLFISSWFPFSVPYVMKLLFLPSSVFSPYDRVDVSYNVLQVPHALPTHWEAEVVVPFENCAVAISELKRVVDEYSIPVSMPVEVRPVKSDDIWLSPNYDRTSCHITLTLYNPSPQTEHTYFTRFFKAVSRKLKLAPRIHWGKYMSGVGRHEVESMYPRLSDFAQVRLAMDPRAIFTNDAIREKFGF
jgi:FAD/FMN-containing dehydrogenase